MIKERHIDKRHKYEYDIDLNGETAPAKVVRMVGTGKCVLEIGAGPGSITRALHAAGGNEISAVEIDPTAIEKLTPFCSEVYRADLNDSSWTEVLPKGKRYDIIVAADVFEHLYDPWNSLKGATKLLKQDGSMVISLPHSGHSAVIGSLLNGNFEYREWGLLDRTHIRFFCMKNIEDLLKGAGLQIYRAEFVVTPPELSELAGHWNNLSKGVRQTLENNQFSQVYQVVLEAGRPNSEKPDVTLTSMPDAKKPITVKSRLRKLARRSGIRKLVPRFVK